MTDGVPNIAGPVAGLVGVGVMAYAAKGTIDLVKEQAEATKKKKTYLYNAPHAKGSRVDSALNKMLNK